MILLFWVVALMRPVKKWITLIQLMLYGLIAPATRWLTFFVILLLKIGGDRVGDAELVATNLANEMNVPKAPEEEPEKTEFLSIETDREDEKEVEVQDSLHRFIHALRTMHPLSWGLYCAFRLHYVHRSIVKLFANAM
ncbi:hypothetical protein PVK06_039554 [Gossypium arboreum]|uniref:Uncharacterized protein n=1 Tax=Gossypium arboreum TaxID=29729 RepID=A0ABR0N3U1_GOSAR|nr:hypothetical protein PVK06_039554 [Gossypium arboreum]